MSKNKFFGCSADKCWQAAHESPSCGETSETWLIILTDSFRFRDVPLTVYCCHSGGATLTTNMPQQGSGRPIFKCLIWINGSLSFTKKKKILSIHFLYMVFPILGRRGLLEPIPAVKGRGGGGGDTLDRAPAYGSNLSYTNINVSWCLKQMNTSKNLLK